MLSWLPRRRPRIASVEAEAEMLVRDLDEAAFRRRNDVNRRPVPTKSRRTGVLLPWRLHA